MDYNIATYLLQNGSFYNMRKEKYCNESVNIGRYLVDNILESVLENLSIKPCEFCKIFNYETNISEYHWAHYIKLNSLEQFLNCLITSENKYQYQLRKIE